MFQQQYAAIVYRNKTKILQGNSVINVLDMITSI